MLNEFKLKQILKKWAKAYAYTNGQPITNDNLIVLLPLLRTVSEKSSELRYNIGGRLLNHE